MSSSIRQKSTAFLITTAVLLLYTALLTPVSSSSSEQHQTPPPPNSEETSCSSINKCFSYGCPLHPLDIIDRNARGQILSVKKNTGGCIEGNNAAVLTLTGFKGAGREQINQDRAFAIPHFRLSSSSAEDEDKDVDTAAIAEHILLGVFDGHGNRGEEVSEYTLHELPRRLSEAVVAASSSSSAISRTLHDIFVEIDATIPTNGVGGCTASVVFKRFDKVYVANAGDSQSFLATYDEGSGAVAVVYASREDKPHLEEERKRVEGMGGRVYIPEKKGGTSRVIAGKTGLAMSRSIGDWDHGKVGVIPDPIVDVIDIQELRGDVERRLCHGNAEGATTDDEGDNETSCKSSGKVHLFAISATDGLLDEMAPDVFAYRIGHSLYKEEAPHILPTFDAIVVEAAEGWGARYRDDIAIAVSKIATL